MLLDEGIVCLGDGSLLHIVVHQDARKISGGFVSRQLGHADVAITARHYAKWCGDDSYREPMALREGEHPADFLARLVPESPHKSPHPVEQVPGGNRRRT